MNTNHCSTQEGNIISLDLWLEQTGISAPTAWRWRKKGWLKCFYICNRLYLRRSDLAEFERRMASGEFEILPKTPKRIKHEENSQ